MIKSLKLKNFQSHKDTVLEFSPGMNVITGSSRHGKTSIFRAINWIWKNRPVGIYKYLSFWDRNEKNKNPKTEISSTIVINDKEIKRIRTKNSNSYKLSVGEKNFSFDAAGSSVPLQVEKAFNLTEVNFQKQFDLPFLVSNSPPEVARFFNKIIRLDIIDRILSKAESSRRSTNKDITYNKKETEVIEEQIKSFDWVERAESQIKKIERRSLDIQKKRERRRELSDTLQEIYDKKAELRSMPKNLNKILKKINQIQDLHEERNRKIDKYNDFMDLMEEYDSAVEEIDNLNSYDFDKILKKIKEIDKIKTKKFELSKELSENQNILPQIEQMNQAKDELDRIYKNLETWIKNLPKICPTCKQPIRKELFT